MTDKKKIREMFKLALNSLLPFELFYKIIGVVIIVPVLIAIFNAAIRFSGYSYITQGNIIDFLKKPMTILILIIITLFFSFYVFIEIAAICISFNNAYYGKRITFKYLLYQTFIKVKKSLYYRNIPIFLVSLLFVPIIGIGFSSSFIGNLSIFKYIAYGIEVNPLVNALYITMMIIVIILSLLLMYTFQYYLINKEKVFTSMKKSIILFFKAFKISLIVFIKFIFIVILPIVVLFFGIAGIL